MDEVDDLDILASLLDDDSEFDDIVDEVDSEEKTNQKAVSKSVSNSTDEEDALAFLMEEDSDDEEMMKPLSSVKPKTSIATDSDNQGQLSERELQMQARIKELEAMLSKPGKELPKEDDTPVKPDSKPASARSTASFYKSPPQKSTETFMKRPKLSSPANDIFPKTNQSQQKKGSKERVAHVPRNRTDKGAESCSSQAKSTKSTSTKRKADEVLTNNNKKLAAFEDESNIFVDDFSGLRIVNPLISSQSLARRMEGRKYVKISQIPKIAVKTGDIQGDWVSIGVLVQKSDAKTGSNGKTFSVWKLSDLMFTGNTPSQALFLFGDVFKEHWKTCVGSVIGLLNPTIMPAKEKDANDVALSLDNPKKLMMMGLSKDFGHCKSNRKSDGKPCGNFINRLHGEYCEYHVQTAYKKMRSKRAECQSGYGTPNNAPLMNKLKGDMNSSTFICNGKSLSADMITGRRTSEKITLKTLTVKGANAISVATRAGVITTQALFTNTRIDESVRRDAKDEKPMKKSNSKSEALLELLDTPTPGSLNLIKHLHQNEVIAKPEVYKSQSASELLKAHKRTVSKPRSKASTNTSTNAGTTDVASQVPMLGRGLDPSGDLFFAKTPENQQERKSNKAKMRALAVLKQKPIEAADPNAVKKKISPKAQSEISKRVQRDCGDEDSEEESTPKRCLGKAFGTIDLNSAEGKKLLTAKSAHVGQVRAAEEEREDKYFSHLEKKEQLEEKMKTVTKIQVKVVICKVCKYTAEGASDLCRKENHPLKYTKSLKRFFACRECKQRAVSYGESRLPDHPCRVCGAQNYEKTCMFKEKQGPKLGGETLLVRGREQEYLNRMGTGDNSVTLNWLGDKDP